MKMERLHSSFSYGDEDSKNLEQLLEAFGAIVSLEDIASAYCKAGRDLSVAGDILCSMQASTSTTSSFESKDESVSMETASSASLDNCSKNAQINISKPKKCTASMGIVSNVIGREFDRPKLSKGETHKMTKPLKLNSDDFPSSLIWNEKAFPENTEKSETLRHDVEEFLFKMLGDGFSLNMRTIQDVVGKCGYDVNKSMDTLIDQSAATLGKSDDIVSIASEKSMDSLIVQSAATLGKSDDIVSIASEKSLDTISSQDSAGSSKSNDSAANSLPLPKKKKSKQELQKEILASLFSHRRNDDDDDDDDVIRPSKEAQRNKYIVDKPLQLPTIEHRTVIKRPQVPERDDDENEESYEVLRKAVKEYWTLMKEYYKAAVEAFVKGEHVKAYKLLEEGNFFMKKAREADEKSAQKLLQPRDGKEELTFDVHHFEPREAIRFLKHQLSNFSGIPSIEYIRVIVGVNDDDAKGPRKRLIGKLLQRDSIVWTEEENGKTMVIKVDEIKPQKLSFFKRSTSSM